MAKADKADGKSEPITPTEPVLIPSIPAKQPKQSLEQALKKPVLELLELLDSEINKQIRRDEQSGIRNAISQIITRLESVVDRITAGG